MKKKLTIALVIGSVVIALGFFLYFIIENEISNRSVEAEVFIPEEIDISVIESDLEFAETIPEYEILFTGLLNKELTRNFYDILVENQDKILTFNAKGIRTDEEIVEEEFTKIDFQI